MNPQALDQQCLCEDVERFLESQRRRKEDDDADNVVSTSPRDFSFSSEKVKRRRNEEEDYDTELFLSPRLKRQRDDDVVAAATLVQLSLLNSQTQTRIQPQTHISRKSLKLELFKCDVCGREFSSYQALGGHKAGHKQQQPIVENANADVSGKRQRKTMLPSGKIHKCSQCHKVFGTGQALGGHMRLHFNGTFGGNKRSLQDAIVITEDELSLRNANCTVKHVLVQDQRIKESESVIGGYKRSQEATVMSPSDESGVKYVLDQEEKLKESEGVLSGYKRSQDATLITEGVESGYKRSQDATLITEGVESGHKRSQDATLITEGVESGHKRSEDATFITEGVISGHKRSADATLITEGGIGDHDKRSSDKGLSEGDEWSPGSYGSEVTQVTNQVLSLRRSLDLNHPPLPEVDESGGGDLEEVESDINLAK